MGVAAMSNELHDVALMEGADDMGVDALHGMAPDEILMREEEEVAVSNLERARCLISTLMAVTHEVTSLRQIRDRVALVLSQYDPDCVEWFGTKRGLKSLGLQTLEMDRIKDVEWERVSGRLLLDLLTASGWEEREVGRRALCLLYAFVPDEMARPPMARSMESIGRAIGLTAANKRSAVSAACKSIGLELVHRTQRLARGKGTGEFWFMKHAQCRERLSVAMKGKRNRRAARGMTNEENRMNQKGEGIL